MAALETAAHDLLGRYGYREIRTPVFEETELFARGIGAETDIVSKEMYTFDDRDGSSITLRPEATAGIVRAVIEHNLMNTDPALKVYALGSDVPPRAAPEGALPAVPPARRGGLRLSPSPTIDAEVVELAIGYVEACGVRQHELVLNSVGDASCRPAYVETLRAGAAGPGLGDVRRLPAPGGDQPAAGARLQGSRGPGDHREPSPDRRPPLRRSAGTTSPRCAGSSSCSASRTG